MNFSELKMHKRAERVAIVEELKAETDNQAAQGLKNALRVGLAYHHAGLMNCERQVVEAAFHVNIFTRFYLIKNKYFRVVQFQLFVQLLLLLLVLIFLLGE